MLQLAFFFRGKLYRQLILRETNGNFEESHKFMYGLNMSTSVERRKREREKKTDKANVKVQRKRQRLTSAIRKDRVFYRFNRLGESGDSKKLFFIILSVCEQAVSWKSYNLTDHGNNTVIAMRGNRNAREVLTSHLT